MKWTIYTRNSVKLVEADTDNEMETMLLSMSTAEIPSDRRADHAVSDERYVFASDLVCKRALEGVT